MDAARVRTGTELTTAVMNTNTFNLMAKTAALKERFLSRSVRRKPSRKKGIAASSFSKPMRLRRGALASKGEGDRDTGSPLEPLSQVKSSPAFFLAGNSPAPR